MTQENPRHKTGFGGLVHGFYFVRKVTCCDACHRIWRPLLYQLSYTPAPMCGTPGATRTHDTRFRKPLLYPLSYRGIWR